ncbi:type II secretion system F family protein [Actinokineospora enzanensis]|uniref:type II secretion system F family protein n=1 Tax=Actinokineospora enzanensis TaxID=155975 RepID=UPI001FE0AE40|nr:type II secretion system F family protein [Actinokineospora enzanensis]
MVIGTFSGVGTGIVVGLVFAGGAWLGAARVLRPKGPVADPFVVAVAWDLLAACLQAGLPVPDAIRAVVDELPGRPRAVLRDVAEQLALGADSARAWRGALTCPETAELARGARRSARSGAALAGVARIAAAGIRDRAGEAAEARAQRVAVVVIGPLGLCFLPAFLCLGVLPVVIGMATRVFRF